jgi:3-isopropylmalate/(R)-2-methylmalate dehydratase large subunit
MSVIRHIGIGGATGYAVEYAGTAISAMSMEGRLTICNMSIEAGARMGMVAPDDTTFRYLAECPYAPKQEEWDSALQYWTTLPSDDEAGFDKEFSFDVAQLAPIVSWGTSPEDCASIDDVVPEPASFADAERARTTLYATYSGDTAIADHD